MGSVDGRKADLFDSSSRNGNTDLFDVRKRKAAAMEPSERGRYDRFEPEPQQKQHFTPNLDLGAMLYPDRISKENYRKIQLRLKDQDKKIHGLVKDLNAREQTLTDRGQEISKRCGQIATLKQRVGDLERENARLDDDRQRLTAGENSLKQLRERREYLQSQLKEKDDLLAVGTKVLSDKADLVKRLEEENVHLRQTVTERDATVSKMSEQIWKVTAASADERTHIALEAQAETTLGMVQGLKQDVKTRDEKVKGLEGQVEKMNRVIKNQNQAKADLQREVEGMKRELAKQREAAENSKKRAREATEVATEQNNLIKRIMEENKRLGGVA